MKDDSQDNSVLACEMCSRAFKSQSGLTLHRKRCTGKGKKALPDRSAIGRRSKNKGKAGERRTAELLTKFTGRNFRKTPGSGGFNKQGVSVAGYVFSGDVICDDARFAFSVENKNQPRNFSFPQLCAVPESSDFAEWWYQTIADAEEVNKLPILFFKAAQTSTQTVAAEHVALNEAGLWLLKYPNDAPKVIFDIYQKPFEIEIRERFSKKTKKIMVELDNPVYVINWRNIQKYVDPERFFTLVNLGS